MYGAIQVLVTQMGFGVSNFIERYEGVGGGPISRKKRYVNLIDLYRYMYCPGIFHRYKKVKGALSIQKNQSI